MSLKPFHFPRTHHVPHAIEATSPLADSSSINTTATAFIDALYQQPLHALDRAVDGQTAPRRESYSQTSQPDHGIAGKVGILGTASFELQRQSILDAEGIAAADALAVASVFCPALSKITAS